MAAMAEERRRDAVVLLAVACDCVTVGWPSSPSASSRGLADVFDAFPEANVYAERERGGRWATSEPGTIARREPVLCLFASWDDSRDGGDDNSGGPPKRRKERREERNAHFRSCAEKLAAVAERGATGKETEIVFARENPASTEEEQLYRMLVVKTFAESAEARARRIRVRVVRTVQEALAAVPGRASERTRLFENSIRS